MSVEVLVVGKDGMGLSPVEVVVPDSEQGEGRRKVLLCRGIQEVLIHGMGAGKQLGKALVTDREGDAQPDGGPKGVAASYPVPKREHVGGIDAEFSHLHLIGGNGDKVFGDVLLVPRLLKKPFSGGVGIREGFLGREGLGGDEEQGGGWATVAVVIS